jgi:hypothetical protein
MNTRDAAMMMMIPPAMAAARRLDMAAGYTGGGMKGIG